MRWIGSPALRLALLVAVVVAGVYGPALSVPFVYDDFPHFVENERLQHPQTPGDIFRNGKQETRPVFNLSLALQAQLFGRNPVAAHAVNILLHGLVAVLLGLIFIRLGGTFPTALLGSLLFAVHPLGVETVTYVNSRSGLLALLFSSLAWWIFLARSSRAAFWSGMGFLVLAMGSKEDAVAAPLIALLMNGEKWPKARRLSVLATMLTLPLLYAVFKSPHIDTVGERVAAPLTYLWQQGFLIPLHLSQFFWPEPLTFDRELPSWAMTATTCGLGWLLMILGGWSLWRYRKSTAALGIVWSVAALLPTHSVAPLLDIHASRILYSVIPGMALACASLVTVTQRGRWLVRGTSSLFLAFLIVRTERQITVWRNPIELWRRDVVAAPHRWRAWTNLSIELAERGRWNEAEQAIAEAKTLAPHEAQTFYNSAALWASRTDGRRDVARARHELHQALTIDPHHVRSRRLQEKLGPEPTGKAASASPR